METCETVFLPLGAARYPVGSQELPVPMLCEVSFPGKPGTCDVLEASHNAFREDTEATIFSVIIHVLECYSGSYYKTETEKIIHMQSRCQATHIPFISVDK